jgi:hypothetical protein
MIAMVAQSKPRESHRRGALWLSSMASTSFRLADRGWSALAGSGFFMVSDKCEPAKLLDRSGRINNDLDQGCGRLKKRASKSGETDGSKLTCLQVTV